jgi:FG-GAP-like repeat
MSKGLVVALLLLCFLPFSHTVYAAEKQAENQGKNTIERMASEIVALFPRAEGKVTGSDDKDVELDIGSDDGLKPGMTVFLFRPGKPIIHPVTKVVLGNTEESLGSIELTSVDAKKAAGVIKELKVTRIIPGDIARLSTEPARILVSADGPSYDTVLFDRLMRTLRESRRFDVAATIQRPGAEPPGKDEASKIAAGEKASYLLCFSSAPSTEKTSTDVHLKLFGADGETALDVSEAVDATPEVYDEKTMDYALVREDYRDFFITEDLPFRGKHMAIGNVCGDGAPEVVVSDGVNLVVYSFNDRILRELWRDPGRNSNSILSVECADLNGNGLDEIYVTNYSEGEVRSWVVEYVDGAFKTICGPVGLFFRVLDVPGRGKMLITTTKGSDSPYSGIICEYKWKDGQLVKGEELDLPSKIKDPYGFVLVDLIPDKVDGKAGKEAKKGPFDGLEIVWVDDSDYVQVLNMDGDRLWKSPERYGGYDNFFEVDNRDLALPNVDPRGKVKGRLIVREDPSGQKVVVLTENVPVTHLINRIKGYTTSDIFGLYWDGTKMDTAWGIRNIDGYIADIEIGEVVKKGREDIMVLVDPTFKIEKKSKTLPVGSIGSITNLVSDKSSLRVYKVPLR